MAGVFSTAWHGLSDFLFSLLALMYHESWRDAGGKTKPAEVLAMGVNKLIEAMQEEAAELRPLLVGIVFESTDTFQNLETALTTTYQDPTGQEWDKERVQRILTFAAWTLYVKEARLREEKRKADVESLKQKLAATEKPDEKVKVGEKIEALEKQAINNILGSPELKGKLQAWLQTFEDMLQDKVAGKKRFYQAIDLMEEEKRKFLRSARDVVKGGANAVAAWWGNKGSPAIDKGLEEATESLRRYREEHPSRTRGISLIRLFLFGIPRRKEVKRG